MKRLLMILLMICMTLPAMAEAPEASGDPECWVVDHGCLTDFLQAWADDNSEAMLALCAPSWKAQQPDPELSLFLLLRNRTAKAWRIGEEKMNGDDRLYAVDILLEDCGGREPQWYRFTFRLALEDGVRYVDPECLAAGEKTGQPEGDVTAKDAAAQNPPEDDLGSWWHEAGVWNHAGDPGLWAEHNARFSDFMAAWMNRDLDAVLTYLTPGWMPDGDDPEWELQRRFYIYIPQSYTIQSVTVGDDTRRATYSIRMIDATPTFDLMAVEFSVEMYWDAGVWYVDPTGLPEAVMR